MRQINFQKQIIYRVVNFHNIITKFNLLIHLSIKGKILNQKWKDNNTKYIFKVSRINELKKVSNLYLTYVFTSIKNFIKICQISKFLV